MNGEPPANTLNRIVSLPQAGDKIEVGPRYAEFAIEQLVEEWARQARATTITKTTKTMRSGSNRHSRKPRLHVNLKPKPHCLILAYNMLVNLFAGALRVAPGNWSRTTYRIGGI